MNHKKRWIAIILSILFSYSVWQWYSNKSKIPPTPSVPMQGINLDFMPIRSFIIPSKGMNKTLIVKDMILAQKKSSVSRGDVVIFHYPKKPNIYFVQRLVAKGGDEVLYVDAKLLIHFKKGDEYIKGHYEEEHIQKYDHKLWVVNPYMVHNKNIHYSPNQQRSDSYFQLMVQQYNHVESFGMEAIFIDNSELKSYKLKGKTINAFYHKVKENFYFTVGDNREHSSDSRFWGDVPSHYLYGVPRIVYFNYHDLSRIGTIIK